MIRRSGDRGYTDFGWLKSRHTFSFGEYHDPACMGFRSLRVINDDRVAPGQGFGAHPHRDMEIISYVVDGALEHKDSMGNGSVMRPGDVQRMSAGTGVRHSEFNHSIAEPVHFLQIWILPERKGLPPGYEQKSFGKEEKQDRLRLIGSRNGRDGSVTINQDMDLFALLLNPGSSVAHWVRPERGVWIQVIRGRLRAGSENLEAGDGMMGKGTGEIQLEGIEEAECLLFDLA
jgi:redox-sensitive bicupin YhaK (pirin superfamily)